MTQPPAFSTPPLMIRARFYATRLAKLYNNQSRRRGHFFPRHDLANPGSLPPATASAHLPIPCEMAPTQLAESRPFSIFFTNHFAEHHPSIAARIPDEQLSLAAAVYLFRYDQNLTKDFVSTTLDAIARRIAEASGKSLPESRRLFTSSAKAATHVYFATKWDKVSTYTAANIPVLLDLQKRSRKLVTLTEIVRNSEEVVDVDPPQLYALLDNPLPVIVLCYADYCSVCKSVRPLFNDAAKAASGKALFVRVNGPRSPQFKLYYQVSSYPTILRFDGDEDVHAFSEKHSVTTESIVGFATQSMPDAATRLTVSPVAEEPGSPSAVVQEDSKQSEEPGRTPAYEWASALIRQGIDEIDALESERSEFLRPNIEFSCGNSKCSSSESHTRRVEDGDPPPLCVLLGGGMGAGKTTAVNLVQGTEFWRRFGRGVVTVEADFFKLNDPLFHVLPNRIVHHDSIIAAEDLFLQAVNSRRDIVFDGTLSWCEYARQTIQMLRDTEYIYERGPGYRESASGDITEVYWVRSKKRSEPVSPYQIELVGVTADADIAVMRGIVRKIMNGRGVPVPDQLHSHRLFSENFEEYVGLVDSVYLFDTTINPSPTDEAPGYEEQLVAIKSGILFDYPDAREGFEEMESGFLVRNPSSYGRFLHKRTLNTMATCVAELYPNQDVDAQQICP